MNEQGSISGSTASTASPQKKAAAARAVDSARRQRFEPAHVRVTRLESIIEDLQLQLVAVKKASKAAKASTRITSTSSDPSIRKHALQKQLYEFVMLYKDFHRRPDFLTDKARNRIQSDRRG